MYKVSVEGHFDAAHFLKGYPGACANLHGHRWKVRALAGSKDLKNGMVVDFKEFKKALGEILDEFDHALVLEKGSLKGKSQEALKEEGFRLAQIPVSPTAENLAKLIYDSLKEAGIPILQVTVYETPNTTASYEADEC